MQWLRIIAVRREHRRRRPCRGFRRRLAARSSMAGRDHPDRRGADPPYQRPPLSKAWLKGEATAESLALRPAAFYPTPRSTCGWTRVTAIDRAAKTVTLRTGRRCAYDFLILATGARARRLTIPGPTWPACWSCARRPMRIAGGGAAARARGSRSSAADISASKSPPRPAPSASTSTIIERESRVLARVACPILSDFFQDVPSRPGRGDRNRRQVVALEGTAGRVTGVRLGDGRLDPVRRGAGRRRRGGQRRTGARRRPELRQRHCRRPGRADGRSGDLRHRRLHQPPVAAV